MTVENKKYALVMKQAWHFSVEQREDTNQLHRVLTDKWKTEEKSWSHVSQFKAPSDCSVARISSQEWHIFILYHTSGSVCRYR